MVGKDVNGTSRVQVETLMYLTCWINIYHVSVSIFFKYPLCRYLPIFFIFAGIYGYCGYL